MPAVKLHQGLVAAFISVVDDAYRLRSDRVTDAVEPGDEDETAGYPPCTAILRPSAPIEHNGNILLPPEVRQPPAISTSSETHPIPEINGSSHSSKNTLGRFGNRSARLRTSAKRVSRVPTSCRARSLASTIAARIRVI